MRHAEIPAATFDILSSEPERLMRQECARPGNDGRQARLCLTGYLDLTLASTHFTRLEGFIFFLNITNEAGGRVLSDKRLLR